VTPGWDDNHFGMRIVNGGYCPRQGFG